MKSKFFRSVGKELFILLLFFATAFSACQKNNNVTNPTTSGLMALNLIPESATPVLFGISNTSLTSIPLSYTNYTGSYLSVNSGNMAVVLYNANSQAVLATTNFLFQPQKYYSAFAIGANGNYENIITDDHLDSLPTTTGNAFVRFINAIPDSLNPLVTIALNGTNVVNEAAPFGTVSNFTGITPGDISLKVNNDSTISVSRTITVAKNSVYTILISGITNTTDTTYAVKINYIQNGMIAP